MDMIVVYVHTYIHAFTNAHSCSGHCEVLSCSITRFGSNFASPFADAQGTLSDKYYKDGLNDKVHINYGFIENTPDNAVTADDNLVIRYAMCALQIHAGV